MHINIKTSFAVIVALTLAGPATATNAGCYYAGDPVVNEDGTVESVEYGTSECYYGGDPVLARGEQDIPEVQTAGYAVYEGDPEYCGDAEQMMSARR
ncbi:MAG: hypothetical protein JSW10_03715 [Pseudomonadota bacterium]|nr:MAG: hypothetical protein JSW10_03715 [Pseudomonadota bacterium]